VKRHLLSIKSLLVQWLKTQSFTDTIIASDVYGETDNFGDVDTIDVEDVNPIDAIEDVENDNTIDAIEVVVATTEDNDSFVFVKEL
jgi:hypothetical protein